MDATPPVSRRYRHNLNESVFDDAQNNPAAAYWVGFLMADGSVSPEGVIRTALAPRDADHLAKLRAFLGASHPVRFVPRTHGYAGGTGACRLDIHCKRLAWALAKYGVVPGKQAREKALLLEGSRDFWRGVMDGDGSIGVRQAKYRGSPQLQLVGGRLLLEQFACFVRGRVAGWDAGPLPHKSIWSVRVSGRYGGELARLLYDGDGPALGRKKQAAGLAASWVPVRGPRYNFAGITPAKLEELHGLHRDWTGVARSLGCSTSALCQMRLRLGMARCSRPYLDRFN